MAIEGQAVPFGSSVGVIEVVLDVVGSGVSHIAGTDRTAENVDVKAIGIDLTNVDGYSKLVSFFSCACLGKSLTCVNPWLLKQSDFDHQA